MTPVDALTLEIDAFDRHLGRRRFLQAVLLATAASGRLAAAPPSASSSAAAASTVYDRAFLNSVARTLIAADALQLTGIDVLANVDHLLARASAKHRAAALRALAWARRLSFLYGGERFALETRTSKFVIVRRLGRLVSSVCLLAFWGDERALRLLDAPPIPS